MLTADVKTGLCDVFFSTVVSSGFFKFSCVSHPISAFCICIISRRRVTVFKFCTCQYGDALFIVKILISQTYKMFSFPG